MTIASSMYSAYISDDTIGLSELLDKGDEQAVWVFRVENLVTLYEFEDDNQIEHYNITNKVRVI